MKINKHLKAEQMLADKLKSKDYDIEKRVKEIKQQNKGDK